jgi:hypothetical protein
MSNLTKIITIPLVFSSYTFLWLIILAKLILQNLNFYYIIIGGVIVVISAIIPPLLVLLIEKENDTRILTIKKKTNVTHEFLIYFMPYLIPFVVVVMSEINTANLIIIFMIILIIMTIYIRANMLYTNPLFLLMDYKLFRVEDENENEFIVLNKKELIPNERIIVYEFNKNIAIGRDENDSNKA